MVKVMQRGTIEWGGFIEKSLLDLILHDSKLLTVMC